MILHHLRGPNRNWLIVNHDRPIVVLNMDDMEQLTSVTFLPTIIFEEMITILRMAYSHAISYVVERKPSKLLRNVSRRLSGDLETSADMLREDPLPETAGFDLAQLMEALNEIGIEVITTEVNMVEVILESVVADPRITVPVTFTLGTVDFRNIHTVTFKVDSPAKFRGWHNVLSSMSNLYIVPAYHPGLDQGKKSQGLINGHTNALIRGDAVEEIMCPNYGGVELSYLVMSGWSTVSHPFYAEGSEVTFEVKPDKLLSTKGTEEVKTLLLALLELENTYMLVNGGFDSPYDNPENVMRKRGMAAQLAFGRALGSEDFCVWAHQILEQEGALETARIPTWFKREGWLEAYEAEGYVLEREVKS